MGEMGGAVDTAFIVKARQNHGLGVVLAPAGSFADQENGMTECVTASTNEVIVIRPRSHFIGTLVKFMFNPCFLIVWTLRRW